MMLGMFARDSCNVLRVHKRKSASPRVGLANEGRKTQPLALAQLQQCLSPLLLEWLTYARGP